MEILHDTLKIRDKFLRQLISEVDEILNPRETFEEWMAKQKSPKQIEDTTADLSPKSRIIPMLVGQNSIIKYIDDFLQLIRTY